MTSEAREECLIGPYLAPVTWPFAPPLGGLRSSIISVFKVARSGRLLPRSRQRTAAGGRGSAGDLRTPRKVAKS